MQLPQSDVSLEKTLKIVAGKLFDPFDPSFVENRVITVSEDSGLILDVQSYSENVEIDFKDPRTVDLRQLTVLPGFVDAHVHLFLHPYSETSWIDQLTNEPLTERTVRATVHAKKTLMAGYTTVRDLGTEGAGDADIALRKCLSGPDALIPGPRYFTANRALVCTGSYGPKSSIYVNREGIDGVTGAEIVDGIDECRKAVRRQIGAGADWIKVYADYRFRSRLADVSPSVASQSIPTFTHDELGAIIDEAHRLGVKVSAHATSPSSISALLDHGVDSIEHGWDMDEETLLRLALSPHRQRTTWVPTISAVYATQGYIPERDKRLIAFGVRSGVRIACGGDTGVFAHGENALEMKLIVSALRDADVDLDVDGGVTPIWMHVLKWATLGGWECVRSARWEGAAAAARLRRVQELGEDRRVVGDNEVPFGVIRKGFAADIIATSGDFESDFDTAVSPESISFVMKAGRVYKRDGKEVPT